VDDQDFHALQREQFRTLAERLQHLRGKEGQEQFAALAEAFRELADAAEGLHDRGPELLYRLLTTTPSLAPSVPRDLLWYLGAECLHFMPDDEIERFTALDEARRAAADRGERYDWPGARDSAATLQ
jgi:hypothetical protein